MSGLKHLSKSQSLDLVGAAKQRQWRRDAKRLGRFEIDEKLDLRSLLHRQVGGLLAPENVAGILPLQAAAESRGAGRDWSERARSRRPAGVHNQIPANFTVDFDWGLGIRFPP
jgi:hypothetical protein